MAQKPKAMADEKLAYDEDTKPAADSRKYTHETLLVDTDVY